ncbi:MAG: hypothetical protein U0996_18725 [Planctomycetaceae bacterium]
MARKASSKKSASAPTAKAASKKSGSKTSPKTVSKKIAESAAQKKVRAEKIVQRLAELFPSSRMLNA